MSDAAGSNPTAFINVGWDTYVQSRRSSSNAHLVGGVPDYAFALDCNLRQKLNAMPGFKRLARAVTGTFLPRIKQQINMGCLKVGPTQMPEVYQMAVDCARRLGIGVPEVFVENNTSMNACAYAIEDDAPLITITTGMLERATPGEIKACIGHECGHIHNNHGLYTILVELLVTAGQDLPGVGVLVSLASVPFKLALNSWSRAAEVTADRAGMICSDSIDDNYTLQAKLMSGGVLGENAYDVQAILRQYDTLRETPVRFLEAMNDHPAGARRIIAEHEFANSEVLYGWRPEWRTTNMNLVSKVELDERCKRYVNIKKSEERGSER